MTARDTMPVQVDVATQEAIIIPASKTLVVTLEIRELMVQLVPVLLGETRAAPCLCASTTTTIIGTGSPPVSMLVTDIMKELTL